MKNSIASRKLYKKVSTVQSHQYISRRCATWATNSPLNLTHAKYPLRSCTVLNYRVFQFGPRFLYNMHLNSFLYTFHPSLHLIRAKHSAIWILSQNNYWNCAIWSQYFGFCPFLSIFVYSFNLTSNNRVSPNKQNYN